MFDASVPTNRYDSAMNGYEIIWQGKWAIWLMRLDHGEQTVLAGADLPHTSPPYHCQLDVQGEKIHLLMDGVSVLEFADSTYRTGNFAFWTGDNNSQILVDNIQIGKKFKDFKQPQKPTKVISELPNWSIYNGQWKILDGQLTHDPSYYDVEPSIWAGAPAIVTTGDFQASFDLRFANPVYDWLGRHGGILFYASVPSVRYNLAMSGYEISWIDSGQPHYRLVRWDNAVETDLIDVAPSLPDPGTHWQLEVQGDLIRFLVDGQLIFEYTDATYRSGHFGFWAFENNNQITVDNVSIGKNFTDDFKRTHKP